MKRTRLPGDDGATSSPAVPVGVSADGLRQRLMPMGLTVGDATVLIPGIDPTWPVPRDDGAVGDPVTHQVLPAYANQGDHGPGWAFWKYKRIDTLTSNRQYPFLQLLAGAYKHRSVERLVDPVSLDNAKREDTQIQAALDAERKRIVVPADEKARQIAKMREQQETVGADLRRLDALYQDSKLFAELGDFLVTMQDPAGGLAMLLYQREQYRVLYEVLERQVKYHALDATTIKAQIKRWYFNADEARLFPDAAVAHVRTQLDAMLAADPLNTDEKVRWWIMRLGFYLFLRNDIHPSPRIPLREAVGVVKQALAGARYLKTLHAPLWEKLLPDAAPTDAVFDVDDQGTLPQRDHRTDPSLSSVELAQLGTWFAALPDHNDPYVLTDRTDVQVTRDKNVSWQPPAVPWAAEMVPTLAYWNALLTNDKMSAWPVRILQPGALRYWVAAAACDATLVAHRDVSAGAVNAESIFKQVSELATNALLSDWLANKFIEDAVGDEAKLVAAFFAFGNRNIANTASTKLEWINTVTRNAVRVTFGGSDLDMNTFRLFAKTHTGIDDATLDRYKGPAILFTADLVFNFTITTAGAASTHWKWIQGELDRVAMDDASFMLRDLLQSWILSSVPASKYLDTFFDRIVQPRTKLDATWLDLHRLQEPDLLRTRVTPLTFWFERSTRYAPNSTARLVRTAASMTLVLAGEYLAATSAFLRQRTNAGAENAWLRGLVDAADIMDFYAPISRAGDVTVAIDSVEYIINEVRTPLVFRLKQEQDTRPVLVKNQLVSQYVTLPWDRQEAALHKANPGLALLMPRFQWLLSLPESVLVLVRALDADKTLEKLRSRLQNQTDAVEKALDEYARIVSGLQSELTDEKALLRRLYQGPRAWHLRPEITGRIELSADVVYALERALSLVHGEVPGMAWCTLDDLTDKAHIASGLPGAFADLVAALDTQSSLGHPHQWNSQMQHNAAPGQRLNALNAVREYTYDQRTRRITRRQGRSTAAYSNISSGGALYYIM